METFTEEKVEEVTVQESDPLTSMRGEERLRREEDEEVLSVRDSRVRDPAFA